MISDCGRNTYNFLYKYKNILFGLKKYMMNIIKKNDLNQFLIYCKWAR